MLNSKCATDDQQKNYLIKLLGNKRLITYLLYRGSVHGWYGEDFHFRCDKKAPTIILFKVKDGDCIGGFTNAKWEDDPNPGECKGDTHALLFNLSTFRQFKGSKQAAIYCN